MAGRKPSSIRAKELDLAIARIKLGKSRTGATELNITTVAKEVGVTPALIHNHYPEIADKIRPPKKSNNQKQQVQIDSLERENAKLRDEQVTLKAKIAKLATQNEVLIIENAELKKAAKSKVVDINR